MTCTLNGMNTLFNFTQFANALLPISTRFDGR